MAEKPASPLPIIGTGLARLLNSSKGIVVIAALGMVTLLTYRGVFTAEQALDFAKWMIGLYLAAIALEDGSSKFGSASAKSSAAGMSDLIERVGQLKTEISALAASSDAPAETREE